MRESGHRRLLRLSRMAGAPMPFGTYFTPAMTESEMRIVDGMVNALDRDVATSDVSDRFKLEWAAFRDEWRAYRAENSGLIARSMNQTWVTTLEYRDRVSGWLKRFKEQGGSLSTPEPPARGSPGLPWKWILLVGGVGIVGWFYFSSPAGEKKAPRRRR